jgi:hypothetical protein
MNKLSLVLVASLAVGIAGSAAQAHHSFSMFDRSREEVVEGTVVRWAFNSPHTLLFIQDAKGTQWVFEGAAPPAILTRTPPISGTTFRVGDHVIAIHCPLRDGRNGGGVGLVITDAGTVYNPADAGCGANQRSREWPEWIAAGFKSRAEAEAKR